MTSYFDAMQRIIEKNGGVILEFTAILFWRTNGTTSSNGSDRSALSMRSAIEKLNERWHQTSIFWASIPGWTSFQPHRYHTAV